jgi:uroporphyrinogen-III synthase
VIHPTSDHGRGELRERLDAARVEVVEVVVYRTVLSGGLPAEAIAAISAGPTPVVVFASPSAIQGFLTALPPDAGARLRAEARAVAIGPTTGRALHDRGFRRVSVARRPTTEALADCVEAAAREDRS